MISAMKKKLYETNLAIYRLTQNSLLLICQQAPSYIIPILEYSNKEYPNDNHEQAK